MAEETNSQSIKARIDEAKQGLFELYLAEIREAYSMGDEHIRRFTLVSLENILGHYQEYTPNLKFDGELAKQIRNRLSLRLSDMALELNIPELKHVGTTVSRYENERSVPRKDSRIGKAYFAWLSRHGYPGVNTPKDNVIQDNPIRGSDTNKSIKIEFDHTQAKAIRKSKRLTLLQAANEIECGGYKTAAVGSLISSYERGKSNPHKNSTAVGEKYLQWLASNGYVPPAKQENYNGGES